MAWLAVRSCRPSEGKWRRARWVLTSEFDTIERDVEVKIKATALTGQGVNGSSLHSTKLV